MWQAIHQLTDLVLPAEEGEDPATAAVHRDDEAAEGVRGLWFGRGDESEDDDERAATPEAEAARRRALEETFAAPLRRRPDGADAEGDGDPRRAVDSGDTEHSDHGRDEATVDAVGDANLNNDDQGILIVEEDEEEEDEGEESVDEEALELAEIRQFLDAFDVEEHTEEISKLLSGAKDNDHNEGTPAAAAVVTPTPLQHHFHTLVPATVSYPEFWARYYYRCDPRRICCRL